MSKKLLAGVALGAALGFVSMSAAAASYVVLGNGPGLDKAIAKAGGKITRNFPQINAAVVELSGESARRTLARSAGIADVFENKIVNWRLEPRKPDTYVSADFNNPPNSGDDDTRFDFQWGHDAVNSVEAWNAGYRGAGARVAVLDGGFFLAHPDIAGQFDPSCTADMTGEGIEYGPNPDDDTGIFSHGMHTASTVAAADNGFGVIGIAPEATLCLVKVLFNEGVGSFGDVAAGILFAAEQNVDVISMSLGADIPKRFLGGAFVFINRAIDYAYQRGALTVVSAGNDARDGNRDADTMVIPADAPTAVTVSATAPFGWATPAGSDLDFPASYSNYGRSLVDVAAPGGDFAFAFTPGGFDNCTISGVTRFCYVWDFVFAAGGNGGGTVPPGNYFYWSVGTSMAAPHAAGVAAIIVSKFGKMPPAQLRVRLERGSDDLGAPGNDPFFGAGRVNAARSVGAN